MTKEEVMAKKGESLQAIQRGLTMIEQLKGNVAANQGKVIVYDELLADIEAADEPPTPFPPQEDGEETEDEETQA